MSPAPIASIALDTIADNLPVMVAYVDREQRYRFVNRAYEARYQRGREQILGRQVREMLGADAYATVRPYIERTLAGEAVRFEMSHVYPDGTRLVLLVDYSPDMADGIVRGFVAHIADISDMRRAEADLELKDQAMTHALNGMAMADMAGRLVYANPAFLALWGYGQAEQVLGRPATAFWVRPEAAAAVIAALSAEGRWRGELEALRADGGRFLAGLNAALIRDAQGNAAYMVAAFEDVTERRREQQQLRAERNFTAAVLDNASALVVVLDQAGRIRRFNRACERLSGYAFAAVEGRYVWDFLLLPEERDRVRDEAFLALAEDPSRLQGSYTNHWLARDGARHLIEWHNTVLLDEAGRMDHMVSIGIDVTARQAVEAALRRSEETYARAEAIAHIGSWDWDITTGGLRWTDEIYRIFGLTPRSFGATYQAFLDAVHGDDRQAVIDAVNASVADAGVPYAIEHRVVRPDGEIRVVSERGKVYRDEQGTPLRMIGTVHDVTEAKAAEVKLRDTLQLLDSVVENIPNMIFIKRADDLSFVLFNRAGEELLGHGREALLGKTDYDLFQREQADFFTAKDREVLARGYVDIPEESIDTRLQGRRILNTKKIALHDAQGRAQYLLGISQDITARKRAEAELASYREHLEELVQARTAALAEREAELRRAQEIAHLGHWHVNLQSGALTWSDEIYRIFGRDPKAFIPSQAAFSEAVHADDREAIQRAVDEAFAEDGVYSIDHRIVLPDGTVRWVHEHALAERDAAGRPLSLTGTVQDITAQKAAEAELIRAKEAAERASLAKSEFLSRMSHELRTPMNAILGFAQVLEMDDISAAQREFVGEIHRAGDHLLELINELLDMARNESGKMAVAIETVGVGEVVAAAVRIVQPQLAARALALLDQCQGDAWVLADATRLRQVLVNLLSNAIKYNRHGGRVELACAAVEGGRMRIAVSDTGLGIPPEKLGDLFTPFERLGAQYTGVDGTGIGLALCKQLMVLMDGGIGVDSAPGQGTTFWIELPLAQRGTAAAAVDGRVQAAAAVDGRVQAAAPASGKTTLLYVEDNAANLKVVEAIFRQHPDTTLLSATTGEFGLELARRYHPDAILLDIHLPGMDGYTVLSTLQADARTADIPVLALSADAMPLDVERGLRAGFKSYLTKPILVEALLQAVAQAITAAGDVSRS